jgi:hypothetical protein
MFLSLMLLHIGLGWDGLAISSLIGQFCRRKIVQFQDALQFAMKISVELPFDICKKTLKSFHA